MFGCFRYAGILSAYGIALADVVHEAQETCSKVYGRGKTWTMVTKKANLLRIFILTFFIFLESFQYLDSKIEELKRICEKELREQGFDKYVN